MTNVEREIEKARRKPMPAEKLKDLLLKLRKNATGTLTFAKLVNVLDAVGWGIEGVIDWVPMHIPATSTKEALPKIESIFRHNNIEALIEHREKLLRAMVGGPSPEETTSPSEAGEVLIGNVGEMRKIEDPRYANFTYDEWRGAEGVVVDTVSGERSGPILHSRYDVENRGKNIEPNRLVHDVWRWMMNNGIEEAIAEVLDIPVHVPASERTRENTGTCPACWGNYKLDGAVLVMHGYRRPGFGYITGKCFGVGYEPAEVSSRGISAVRDELLVPDFEGTEESIDNAEAGKVTKLEGRKGEIVDESDPRFKGLLRDLVEHLKRKAKHLRAEIDVYDKLLVAWHPRPMPREGELQRGTGFFLK
jgi:hypothetical protein